MQVDLRKPKWKAPGPERLKRKYEKLLSSFAFNVNLRRYYGGKSALDFLEEMERKGFNEVRGQYVAGWCRLTP